MIESKREANEQARITERKRVTSGCPFRNIRAAAVSAAEIARQFEPRPLIDSRRKASMVRNGRGSAGYAHQAQHLR